MPPACRPRAAIITAITGKAGHAVIFMAHAIPIARATQNSASTGGSVIPTASGSASTGVVTVNVARRSAS